MKVFEYYYSKYIANLFFNLNLNIILTYLKSLLTFVPHK